MSDKALREKMLGMPPEAVAETAKAQGFEVTAEELMAAREELRNGDSSVTALM